MVDIIICVAIGLGLFEGFRRGAVVQIGSIAGAIAAIIASRLIGAPATRLVISLFGWPEFSTEALFVAPFLGHLIIFFIGWWAGGLLSGVLRELIKAVHLGVLDSVCGALVMGLKVMIAASILLNLWLISDESLQSGKKSVGGSVAQTTLHFVPDMLGYAGVKTADAQQALIDHSGIKK